MIVSVVKGEPLLPAKLASRKRAPGCRRSSPTACAPSRCGSTKSSASPATSCRARASTCIATASPTGAGPGHDLEGRPRQRAGADRRHPHGAGRERRQAGPGHGRDDRGDPEQAERLALASTEGKIQLALRNPLDQSAPATPGIKQGSARRRPRPGADAERERRSAEGGPAVTVATIAPTRRCRRRSDAAANSAATEVVRSSGLGCRLHGWTEMHRSGSVRTVNESFITLRLPIGGSDDRGTDHAVQAIGPRQPRKGRGQRLLRGA